MLGVLGEIGSATPAVCTVVEWRRMGEMPLVFPIRKMNLKLNVVG
jgi:hypothetical protein